MQTFKTKYVHMKTKTSFILILIVVLVAATYFGAFDNHEETLPYHQTWKNCVFTLMTLLALASACFIHFFPFDNTSRAMIQMDAEISNASTTTETMFPTNRQDDCPTRQTRSEKEYAEALKCIITQLNDVRKLAYAHFPALEKLQHLKHCTSSKELLTLTLTEEEKDAIMAAVDQVSNQFASRLRQQFNLNHTETLICCLTLLGMHNKDIIILTDIKAQTIKKTKHRLKRLKLNLPIEACLEDFLLGFQDVDAHSLEDEASWSVKS